jgi:ribosomal protein S18 acetylase RimI-like enzyme
MEDDGDRRAREAAGGPELVLRPAAAADAAEIAALAARTFRDTFAGTHDAGRMAVYLAEVFTPERIAAEIAAPTIAYLAAWRDGRAVGYAKLALGEPPACVGGPRAVELERLYVEAALHGSGVAAALMTACLEEARRRDFETLWLGVWDRNPRARRFYEKWGFRTVGTKPFVFAGDVMEDLVMARAVEEPGPS